jgi:hypothetical protein
MQLYSLIQLTYFKAVKEKHLKSDVSTEILITLC